MVETLGDSDIDFHWVRVIVQALSEQLNRVRCHRVETYSVNPSYLLHSVPPLRNLESASPVCPSSPTQLLFMARARVLRPLLGLGLLGLRCTSALTLGATSMRAGVPRMMSMGTTTPDVTKYYSQARPNDTKDYAMQQTMIRLQGPPEEP